MDSNLIKIAVLFIFGGIVGCSQAGDDLNPDSVLFITYQSKLHDDFLMEIGEENISIDFLDVNNNIVPAPLDFGSQTRQFSLVNYGDYPETRLLLAANYLGVDNWATTFIRFGDDTDTLECYYTSLIEGDYTFVSEVRYNGIDVEFLRDKNFTIEK